jgi:hypothetical protein
MAELTFTLVVVGTLALEAAVFVALVVVGVRLAIGAPLMPDRQKWSRQIRSSFHRVKSTVARARHYSGADL